MRRHIRSYKVRLWHVPNVACDRKMVKRYSLLGVGNHETEVRVQFWFQSICSMITHLRFNICHMPYADRLAVYIQNISCV